MGAPSAVVAAVGGVLPGALLLAAGYYGATGTAVTGRRSQPASEAGPAAGGARW